MNNKTTVHVCDEIQVFLNQCDVKFSHPVINCLFNHWQVKVLLPKQYSSWGNECSRQKLNDLLKLVARIFEMDKNRFFQSQKWLSKT